MAAESYAWTLYAFMGLTEVDRIDRAVDEVQAVVQAQRVALGYHNPKELYLEQERVRAAVFGGSRALGGRTREELLQTVAAINAQYQAFGRGRTKVIRGD